MNDEPIAKTIQQEVIEEIQQVISEPSTPAEPSEYVQNHGTIYRRYQERDKSMSGRQWKKLKKAVRAEQKSQLITVTDDLVAV